MTKEPSVLEASHGLKKAEHLPSAAEQTEALGIPNWKELERKVVKPLAMTLLPCFWVLYLFNYLDRASVARARLSSLDGDLNLQGTSLALLCLFSHRGIPVRNAVLLEANRICYIKATFSARSPPT